MKRRQGFTILEMSIAIIIISVLATLIMVSLGPVRENNRNIKRLADINEMRGALRMFYRDWGVYPATVTPGASLVSGSNTYLLKWPENPTPRNDGNCPDSDYSYSLVNAVGGSSYSISFCLSAAIDDVGPNTSYATPDNIITCLPNCVKPCGSGSNSCGGTCPNVVSCGTGETCINDRCVTD